MTRASIARPPVLNAEGLDLQPDEVRAIRYKLRQSQPEFAGMIGVTLPTLQKWEDGRAHPDGPALALLRVAARNPKIVAKALGH